MCSSDLVCFALAVAARNVVTLTEEGTALRARAEQVPPAIIARLGMPLSELESLHASLTSVIATARP